LRLPWKRAGGARERVVLHVGDPRFDDWEVVHDFEDLVTARAWRRHLDEAGIEAVITSDWPLDRFGRGDIALRVRPGSWSEADEFLSGLNLDDDDDDL
jgi:hypothetical protein